MNYILHFTEHSNFATNRKTTKLMPAINELSISNYLNVNKARALLEYPVTCNCTRLFTQTTVLDKSGHDCGKFNHIKCNRIPTQRSIQKLSLSN